MSLTLALLSLPVTLYLGIRLYDKVYAKAMEAARVDIGRELKFVAARFSHQPEIVRVLDVAAEMALCGCAIDGAEVKREVEEGRTG